MQPSVKKGENLHFFNFSEVGINGGKHRLNQCRNWGYYDGGLNANFGIRVKLPYWLFYKIKEENALRSCLALHAYRYFATDHLVGRGGGSGRA
jgi:hypothetical protein